MLFLRLTFGGAPGQYEWGVISETICDLAMAIMQDEDWDPATLSSPEARHIPNLKCFGDDVPFGEGRELIVDVPVDPKV